VENVNARQKRVLFDKIMRYFDGNLTGKTMALWGLAFKPNTDDMREAPSRVLMEAIWAAGGRVRAYDPEARGEARRIYGQRDDFELCETSEAAVAGADALVVVTEWQEFRSPDFEMLKGKLTTPVVFDGRNIYDPDYLHGLGFAYYGIGRGIGRHEPG
jgi:UDPglucose 6-dehydrogenase